MGVIVWIEIGLSDWQHLSSKYKKVTYQEGFHFYKRVFNGDTDNS